MNDCELIKSIPEKKKRKFHKSKHVRIWLQKANLMFQSRLRNGPSNPIQSNQGIEAPIKLEEKLRKEKHSGGNVWEKCIQLAILGRSLGHLLSNSQPSNYRSSYNHINSSLIILFSIYKLTLPIFTHIEKTEAAPANPVRNRTVPPDAATSWKPPSPAPPHPGGAATAAAAAGSDPSAARLPSPTPASEPPAAATTSAAIIEESRRSNRTRDLLATKMEHAFAIGSASAVLRFEIRALYFSVNRPSTAAELSEKTLWAVRWVWNESKEEIRARRWERKSEGCVRGEKREKKTGLGFVRESIYKGACGAHTLASKKGSNSNMAGLGLAVTQLGFVVLAHRFNLSPFIYLFFNFWQPSPFN